MAVRFESSHNGKAEPSLGDQLCFTKKYCSRDRKIAISKQSSLCRVAAFPSVNRAFQLVDKAVSTFSLTRTTDSLPP
jgi:hypothetical protein